MGKKEVAVSFLQMAGMGEVKTAYERFISPKFIHHNQYFEGDRQSLMEAMLEAHKKVSNKSVEVKKSFEDGNFVITHSLVTRKKPEEPAVAVVHIFRFENEKIVELWDLGQPIMKDSPNKNGPF